MTNQYVRALCVACACVLAFSGCSDKPANNAPIASDLAISTTEDTPHTATVTALDADRDTLTASVATAPTRGAVVTNGTSFTYTPHANQNGADQFMLRIDDGRGGSATANVSVTIAAVNDAPQIQPTLALDEDQQATTQLVTDIEGQSFQVTLVTPPTHGTATLDAATAGRITYTPDRDFFGVDTLQVTAVDASSATTTAAVQITVRPVNDGPVAVADVVATTQASTVLADVLANDTDVDDTTLTLSIVTPPARGTAIVTGSRIEYSSGAFIGETSLTYQARDAAGATSTATLTLRSALRTPIVYETAGGTALYYADGIRSFRLHEPLPVGAHIVLLKAAKTAPLVFFTVLKDFTYELFYVDLRQPGAATRLSRDFTTPGTGVGDFAISDDGSKVAYNESGASNMWLIETAHPGVEVRLGRGGNTIEMDAAGTRVFYSVVPFSPGLQPSAIFTVALAQPEVETRVTPFAQPPDAIIGPIYVTRDARRLIYSVGNGLGRMFAVDPAQSGSDVPLFDLTPLMPLTMLLQPPLDDEMTFSAVSLAGGAINGYVLHATTSPSVALFSGGTPANAGIRAHVPTSGGQSVFYLRAAAGTDNADLYRVDMSNPAVSTRIADHSTKTFGVINFALSPDASRIFYATLDMVPIPSGGGAIGPGNADVYFLPTDGSAARHLQHFDEAAEIGRFAPDGGYAVIEEGRFFSLHPRLHAFNALDPGQIVPLTTLSGDEGYGEYLFVVAP
jgi:hypothetical protein